MESSKPFVRLDPCRKDSSPFGTDEAGHIYAVGYEGMVYQLDFRRARFDEIKPD